MTTDKIRYYLKDIADNTLKMQNNPVLAYARLIAIVEELDRDMPLEADKASLKENQNELPSL